MKLSHPYLSLFILININPIHNFSVGFLIARTRGRRIFKTNGEFFSIPTYLKTFHNIFNRHNMFHNRRDLSCQVSEDYNFF